MRGVNEEVFTSVLELLVEEGYVKLENYFVDGRKVEANANQHKTVWEKSRAKYQQRLRAKVKELLKEIEAVNETENEAYGDKDLEELGGGGEMDAEKLEKKIAELNQWLKEKPEDKKLAKAVKVMEKYYLLRQKRYEEQERKQAGCPSGKLGIGIVLMSGLAILTAALVPGMVAEPLAGASKIPLWSEHRTPL